MSERFDVAVVGYGPVGMTVAALLAQAGHKVVVFERYEGIYNLPRAATFDDETMRTFARLGIAEKLIPFVQFQPNYEWHNAKGELLIEYRYDQFGWSGWAEWYQMHQPDVENALHKACLAAGVDVRFATEVIRYHETSDFVIVTTSREEVHADFVIAADGGNGFSRSAIGATYEDLGFSEPWMVCDFSYDQNPGLPRAVQVGDPVQPVSIIALGPKHHRFSFMLESAEDFHSEKDPDKVWTRVADYLQPAQAELIRVATYTFRSLIVDIWRSGRIFLAGDAAHQMPPFLGQGMCSGIRDAVNLATKVDLVLRGESHASILDTYQSERQPHVTSITLKAIELGKIQTTRDPQKAATRDAQLLANRNGQNSEKLRLPSLGPGFFSSRSSKARGAIMPQGRLRKNGKEPKFDEIYKPGFHLIVNSQKLENLAKEQAPSMLDAIITIQESDDVDAVYTAWFNETGTDTLLVRPDAYIFGASSGAEELTKLLQDFEARFLAY